MTMFDMNFAIYESDSAINYAVALVVLRYVYNFHVFVMFIFSGWNNTRMWLELI
jgi:hypothetical protein